MVIWWLCELLFEFQCKPKADALRWYQAGLELTNRNQAEEHLEMFLRQYYGLLFMFLKWLFDIIIQYFICFDFSKIRFVMFSINLGLIDLWCERIFNLQILQLRKSEKPMHATGECWLQLQLIDLAICFVHCIVIPCYRHDIYIYNVIVFIQY